MTIASELQALQTNLNNSYSAVSTKGGTLPQTQNFNNLAAAIGSIPSGGGSSGDTLGYIFVNHYGSNAAEIYLCEGQIYTFDSSAVVTKSLKKTQTIQHFPTLNLAVHYWQVQPNTTYSLFYYNGNTYGEYIWIKYVVMNTTAQADISSYTENTGGGNN